MSRLGADGLLLTTAFLWGVTFVAQKYATATMPALAFVAARFAVSAAALAPFALWEFRRKPHAPEPRRMASRARDRPDALLWHDPAAGGDRDDQRHQRRFPDRLLCRADTFRRLGADRCASARIIVGAGFVSLFGAWLLSSGGAIGPPDLGDALVLLADFAWATGIALTPIFLARSGRPLLLAFVQYAICAGLAALCSALVESTPPGALVATLPTILFAGIVSGALAYTIQIFAQAHTPPAEAALILALEGVFAALAGALLLDERLTAIGAFGCVLILAGAVVVEIGPLFGRKTVSEAT